VSKDLAIVLNNGSINSAVATAIAAQRYRLVMLHMVWGSQEDEAEQTTTRGRVAFDQQTAHFKPYREHVLEMPFLSLLNTPAAPKRTLAEGTESRSESRLSAPLLDLLPLIATSARFAVHHQAAAIYLGLRVGPSVDELAQATEYVQIWQDLIQLPCGIADLELSAPLLEMEPWQVVDLGFQLNVPFERTWSCMGDGGEPCWACRGCRARESAFQQAAKPDPLRLARRG
jgi:7-cyano-7-deazaguanine synthase in queuosine biosynthesis